MADERHELLELVRATRAELEWWRETGVETGQRAPIVATSTDPALARDPDAPAVQPLAPPTVPDPPAVSAPVAMDDDFLTHPGVRATETLPDLRAVIGDCQRCKLAPHRTQIVFGVGNPNADLVFVGEAPGGDEDLRGEPFVGRAGQLLTEIIVKGMKIRRQDVYIANIIKCRPPQNRDPEPDEIAACEPFLKQQLVLIRPKVIVTLGKFAAQCLLKTRTPITRLRGAWASYQGIPLMPTFHPAYLLRNPSDKRLVWQDIQQVMKALGLL
ncbi:MAG: uracil-DNA glycosylase [Candidatus Binatia bacterium]